MQHLQPIKVPIVICQSTPELVLSRCAAHTLKRLTAQRTNIRHGYTITDNPHHYKQHAWQPKQLIYSWWMLAAHRQLHFNTITLGKPAAPLCACKSATLLLLLPLLPVNTIFVRWRMRAKTGIGVSVLIEHLVKSR